MFLSHLSSRRARAAVAVVAIAALALAGCSDDEKEPTKPEASATGSSASGRDSGTLVQTSPLTGLKAEHGLPKHPVAVVKVDNTHNAHPQVGLDKADLVVEELVEGGLTRLAAMYYSKAPNRVGPVRSMRDTDIGITNPTHGVLVASGGASGTVRRLRSAGVKMYSETNGNINLEVDGSRRAPYNRILDLKSFEKKLRKVHREPKQPYLSFGDESQFSGRKAPKRLTVRFSPAHQTTWKFHHGTWVRQNGETARPADEFKADNLLVLSARVSDAGYLDPAGSNVPDTIFKGTGKAQLFHGGKSVTGTWSKDSLGSALRLEDKSGKRLTVPAGHTWIELIPKDGGSVSRSR
ncbi:MAG: DUF3048 domain-containing protein [Nocardioidaceae bacterium]